MTFGLAPPKNVDNLFGNWLKGIPKDNLSQIRVGVCVVIWAIWNTRNDWVFNKRRKNSFLQVIPVVSHWIRMWSFIQQEEQREVMDSGCNRMETVTLVSKGASACLLTSMIVYFCPTYHLFSAVTS
jgi:hypothetical protein